MSGLSGIAPAVLRSLECAPSGREWSSPWATLPVLHSSRCSPPRQHSSPVRSPMDAMHDRDRVAVRLGWSGMALAIDDRPPAGECRAGRLWTLCTIDSWGEQDSSALGSASSLTAIL